VTLDSPEKYRDCTTFTGYKPCYPGVDCSEQCRDPRPFGMRILVVSLDAMGAVLMTTAQLEGLRRAYPESTVFWVTRPAAMPLLQGNPFLHRVLPWTDEQRMVLQQMEFDLVLNADKSVGACAFVNTLRAREVRGFRLNTAGQIIPANPEAEYSYRLGLDDELKFRRNTRTGQDILAEAWKLPYARAEYVLVLSPEEGTFCREKRREWGLEEADLVVGFNTGCSDLFPNKKMTVAQHLELIRRLARRPGVRVLLLGGREDTERNARIADMAMAEGIEVVNTPTTEGLRRGICYENLADVVITGDTLGMHIAIGLRKHVLAWFGLSCQAEIDLYERGKKFYREDLECSPCWKRECPHNLECISGIDLDAIEQAVWTYLETRTIVSSSAGVDS